MPVGIDPELTRETMMQGGYYRYDFPNTNLTFLGLNSIFFMNSNKCALEDGSKMLDWVESLLSEERDFLLSMHVFPGVNSNLGGEQYWQEDVTVRFESIVSAWIDKITLLAGAHIHHTRITAPPLRTDDSVKLPLLATLAMTPIGVNNPSYTKLELDPITNNVLNETVRSYQL